MLALTLAAAVLAESALARVGLGATLNASPSVRVVAEAEPAEAAQLAPGSFDLVVYDLPDAAPAREIGEVAPAGVPVLALVGQSERARELLRAGARGVLRRDATTDELEAASVAIASGLYALDAPALQGLLAGTPNPGAPLTPREREVLELVAEGLSNKVIALRLGISEHTAKFHVNSLLDKLEADTRTDAVVRAARRGWLSL